MYFPWRCCSPEHKTVLTTVQSRKRKGVNLKGAAVFELFPGENEALLVGGDALLVLDLGFYHVDGIRAFYLQGHGLSRKSLMSATRSSQVGILNKDTHSEKRNKCLDKNLH